MEYDLTNPHQYTVHQMGEGYFQAMLDHGGPYQNFNRLSEKWANIDSPPYWRQRNIYRVHLDHIKKQLPDMSQNERAYVFLSGDERAALGDDASKCLQLDWHTGDWFFSPGLTFLKGFVYRTPPSRVSGTWAVDSDGDMIPGTEVAE